MNHDYQWALRCTMVTSLSSTSIAFTIFSFSTEWNHTSSWVSCQNCSLLIHQRQFFITRELYLHQRTTRDGITCWKNLQRISLTDMAGRKFNRGFSKFGTSQIGKKQKQKKKRFTHDEQIPQSLSLPWLTFASVELLFSFFFFQLWFHSEQTSGFFAGTQQQYYELLKNTFFAIKSVDPSLRVGGPSTCQSGWITETLTFCKENGIELDFVATHQYPTDPNIAPLKPDGMKIAITGVRKGNQKKKTKSTRINKLTFLLI